MLQFSKHSKCFAASRCLAVKARFKGSLLPAHAYQKSPLCAQWKFHFQARTFKKKNYWIIMKLQLYLLKMHKCLMGTRVKNLTVWINLWEREKSGEKNIDRKRMGKIKFHSRALYDHFTLFFFRYAYDDHAMMQIWREFPLKNTFILHSSSESLLWLEMQKAMQFVSNKRQASEIKSGSVTTAKKRNEKEQQQRGCINFEFSPVRLALALVCQIKGK